MALARRNSVPIPLDAPGSFQPLLMKKDSEQPKLARHTSTPLPGDERLRTLEMFIEVHEMSGTSHELGRFHPEQSVAEVKRKTSQEMCVPEQTLKLVRGESGGSDVTTSTSNSSLDSDEWSLGDVTKPFTPAMMLQAVVQMPPEYEETLSRLDDIRVHEDAYGQLVSLACEFDSVTSANVNLSKRIIAIIDNGLRSCTHPTSRMWAIEALKKLAKHLLKQARKFDCKATDANGKGDCLDNLRSAIDFITEVFEELSKSESSLWIEKQDADEALAEICNAAIGGAVRHGGA